MGRGGTKKDRGSGPERRCIATGEVRPAATMVRFVVAPDGVIAPDVLGRLPGRGLWVAATREALDRAVSRKCFARAARQAVSVPDGLGQSVETQLARRTVDLISLARKGGHAVAGYEKVKAWLDREEARVLIQASDGSPRGKSKLSTPHFGTFIGWLAASELGLAFGRETVIHAALGAGGLTQRVVEEARRLRGFRMNAGSDDASRGARPETESGATEVEAAGAARKGKTAR